ncbi:hypothetical protein NG895_30035 [Aeoliella sp. ICT_H6.2]|uniref:Transposase n=1 Tax=Aeoliella straminimaris TaxID=2954799 RepID=A0A9X2FJD1_9BACT|nr:hypothetical protein [Aeoliella straminimaris]MCO6048156.1 hypothetical protein [Aeoliella straminimaris]
MLYLAIDHHAKQITVCVRNEEGETMFRQQVSTRPEKIESSSATLGKLATDQICIDGVTSAAGRAI